MEAMFITTYNGGVVVFSCSPQVCHSSVTAQRQGELVISEAAYTPYNIFCYFTVVDFASLVTSG